MSQMRAQGGVVRAASAVVAVCALIFSLLVSGAAHGPHAYNVGARAAHSAGACHNPAGAADVVNKASQPVRGGDHIDCAQCCLAAVAGAAVLPGRVATLSRPPQLSSSPVRYFAFPTRKPETAASRAVNGARAPPALVVAA